MLFYWQNKLICLIAIVYNLDKNEFGYHKFTIGNLPINWGFELSKDFENTIIDFDKFFQS